MCCIQKYFWKAFMHLRYYCYRLSWVDSIVQVISRHPFSYYCTYVQCTCTNRPLCVCSINIIRYSLLEQKKIFIGSRYRHNWGPTENQPKSFKNEYDIVQKSGLDILHFLQISILCGNPTSFFRYIKIIPLMTFCRRIHDHEYS